MKKAARTGITGYLWTGVAVLVCPCHLPLLIGALAGTTVGALVSNHWVVALFSLATLFFFSAARAWMALSEAPCSSRCEQARGPVLGAEEQERRIVSLRATP
ncbi:MAG: broad-spectrum mercury transporter MerE [Proteobacteria bacterium]|nr:broad-spectrum mercury transporter MerE [Pseudomonadota bacterium]